MFCYILFMSPFLEAKDALGTGGSPGADGGAAKAAMPGEQAKP